MVDAMSHGYRHPLDVDLADFAGDLVDAVQRESLEDHLSGCLLCRIKVRRLRDALGGPSAKRPIAQTGANSHQGIGAGVGSTIPKISLPAVISDRPAPGQLWVAGNEERLLVLVLRDGDGRVSVAPVTFDTLAADDETIVVDATLSPFGMPVAVHPMLAAELPTSSLITCYGQLAEASDVDQLLAGTIPGTAQGDPIDGPTDPRLEFRQMLADHLGALEEVAPDPDTAADAPAPRPEHLASALAVELRDRRGQLCKLYRLNSWEGLTLAHSQAWTPVATVDELGTVLIVFDTPSGLKTGEEFNVAMSVLTRYNATAVVVLASSLTPNSELFDAISLSNGIGVPSGQISPPRPILSGLAPADAIAKFLDQNSSWSEDTRSPRASTTPSDVLGTLSRSATLAIAEVTHQGSRARIAPKVAGYTSIEPLVQDLEGILRSALAGEPVAQHLSELANRGKR
jgi:hypothetical protein